MRVFVTGIGVITPVGIGTDDAWKGILSGRVGFAPITRFDTSGYKVKLAAEVAGFDPNDFVDKKLTRRNDRYCHFALAAAALAMKDAGLTNFPDPYRAGVIVGSGVGGIGTHEDQHTVLMEKGASRVSPFYVPMMIPNMAAGLISIQYGVKGISYAPVSACATGVHALGDAFRNIKYGALDFCIAGGAEAAITPMAVAGFANMTALSEATDPLNASIPFDKRRDGFVIGEGAGILLLESEESAVRRGAKVYGEVLGYGATSDAFHITGPDPEGNGAEAAMRMALDEAGLETVDYVNAHGTSTPAGDKAEVLAVKKTFAKDLPPVSSTKSMTGHLLGAAGGIETAFSLLAIRDGILPPTMGYQEPDPECDIDVVPNAARKSALRTALSNSFGFGGHNASILVGKAG
ncbi:MAG: beta-ketoacyl-ACP synthase II [Oscillospiraceae bacterium]|jgi:3-oxoacyl-[acyl-carrier-protein] synthase II|nr:beta-ketoacyl-ACP synthase II [Oscillospiraceae bacterium]